MDLPPTSHPRPPTGAGDGQPAVPGLWFLSRWFVLRGRIGRLARSEHDLVGLRGSWLTGTCIRVIHSSAQTAATVGSVGRLKRDDLLMTGWVSRACYLIFPYQFIKSISDTSPSAI